MVDDIAVMVFRVNAHNLSTEETISNSTKERKNLTLYWKKQQQQQLWKINLYTGQLILKYWHWNVQTIKKWDHRKNADWHKIILDQINKSFEY